jgi:hypothetical protein
MVNFEKMNEQFQWELESHRRTTRMLRDAQKEVRRLTVELMQIKQHNPVMTTTEIETEKERLAEIL